MSFIDKIPEKFTVKMLQWDKSLYHHSLVAAEYAAYAAQKLGLSPYGRQILIQGVYLHDIGKIEWPKAMLYKRLSEGDRKLVLSHPIRGSEIVKAEWPDVLQDVLKIIEQHHERIGGTGYPKKLKKLDWLVMIASAVEVYTALREPRAYRNKCFTHNESITELNKVKYPKDIINVLQTEKGRFINKYYQRKGVCEKCLELQLI